MSCLNDHEFEIVSNMSKHGGSFVKALAECFHYADMNNKLILINSFPHYWEQYAPSKWSDNLAMQAEQDSHEESFTGDAFLK